jgi:hypothetical protein
LKANHEPRKWFGTEINPGEFITSRDKLSSETGISTQSIRTILNRLKSTNEITIKSTSKYTKITICNWDTYQNTEEQTNQVINQQTNQQLTNNQPATNQQLTTNKNDKKLKNDKNDKKISACKYDLKSLLKALQDRYGKTSPDLLPFRAAIDEAVKDGFDAKLVNNTMKWLAKSPDIPYMPNFSTPNKLRDNLPSLYSKSKQADPNRPSNILTNQEEKDYKSGADTPEQREAKQERAKKRAEERRARRGY